MKKLVALGGILIAISTSPGTAETVVPNPRPGTVLWKRFVKDLDAFTPIVTSDGTLWVGVNGLKGAVIPRAFDPRTGDELTNALPSFTSPDLRLRAASVFLPDGRPVVFQGDGYSGTLSAGGSNPWTTTNLSRVGFGLGTRAGTFLFPYSPGQGTTVFESRFASIEGTTGQFVFDQGLGREPHSTGDIVELAFCGFGPGGTLLMVGRQIDDVDSPYLLAVFDANNGSRLSVVRFPAKVRPYSHRPYLISVTTESGLVGISAKRITGESPYGEVGGVLFIDSRGRDTSKFVTLGKDPYGATGLTAGRDGLIYATLKASNGDVGLRGIDPVTGTIVMSPDLFDIFSSAPALGKDGTLYAVGDWGRRVNPEEYGATLYAIATGSKGGLARSPWPRSTGDNLNSFREQGVEDSDGDGLTDEDEVSNYRTDPRLTDTDGDGYSDGVEVQNGSDPLNKSNIPEILEAQVAIKLSFGTNVGQRYRLQSSIDLVSWANEGEPFDGTGTRSTQLVEASRARFYWRLVKAVQ